MGTSDRKCAVVERFNLTIQQLLYKLMANYNTYAWTNLLPHAMKIYLNRKHSTIKMSPLDAEKEENQKKIKKVYSIKYQKAENDKKKPKFKVGETERQRDRERERQRGRERDKDRQTHTHTHRQPM